MLYSLEYCIENNVTAGIFLHKVSPSFQEYLKKCYGSNIVLTNIENVYAKNLVHSFIFEDNVTVKYENYFYVHPDVNSTKYLSETEQTISLVKALFPSNHNIPNVLEKLVEDKTDRVCKLNIESKYIFYPGCASPSSVKRWPLYLELMKLIGKDNVIFIGGTDDLNIDSSYTYKCIVTNCFPRPFTNRKNFWNICKKMNLLEPFAHNIEISKLKNSYFNVFNWGELVFILRHCKGFVGNDGGLMHLAAAAGAKGVAIFGPSSMKKNKPFNSHIKKIYQKYSCQPCQFAVDGISMSKHYISCPYQVKCLADISCSQVLSLLQDGR